MKSWKFYSSLVLAIGVLACHPGNDQESDIKITSVEHTSVKRQSIGNCWLYAHSTWLESKLKTTTGEDIDVSESYWTYWDFYLRLANNHRVIEEIQTGGSWARSTHIIRNYGWVEEKDFIAEEKNESLSRAQRCAEDFVNQELADGGRLADPEQRTSERVHEVLHEAFSCQGEFHVDLATAYSKRRNARDTILYDAQLQESASLLTWLGQWQQVHNTTTVASRFEGKRLLSSIETQRLKNLEQRIKRALNDRQPVVLSFYVSFNAPNATGLFNLDSLAKRGQLGQGGGHMVVLHDYTVHLPDVPEIAYLGEGDMDDEMKALALTGELDYLVAKNSWGSDREDRPWIGDGYSRFSWDYLTARYFDEESQTFRSFLHNVVFPPGY